MIQIRDDGVTQAGEGSFSPVPRVEELARVGQRRIAKSAAGEFLTLYSRTNSLHLVARKPISGNDLDTTRGLTNELSLVLNIGVECTAGGRAVARCDRSAPFLFPDWVTKGYESEGLATRDARLLLQRTFGSGRNVNGEGLRARTLAQQLEQEAKELGLPIEVRASSAAVDLVFYGALSDLQLPALPKFLRRVAEQQRNGNEIHGFFDPDHRAIELLFTQNAALPDGWFVAGLKRSTRTLVIFSPSPDRTAEIDTAVYRETGWRAEHIFKSIPKHERVLFHVESDVIDWDRTNAPRTRDISQIAFAIPRPLLVKDPTEFGRFVKVTLPPNVPRRIQVHLKTRLSELRIPALVVSDEHATCKSLSPLELDEIIRNSLPREGYLRSVRPGENGRLQVRIFIPKGEAFQLSELQSELTQFLDGVTIADWEAPVRGVLLDISHPTRALRARLRRAGPIFQDFIARAADSDGCLRVRDSTSGELSIAQVFQRAVFPHAKEHMGFPSELEWVRHLGRSPRPEGRSAAIAIDLEGTKFSEDAVSASALPDERGWKVTVHIARVSRFVFPGSDLDQFAKRRLLAVYPENHGPALWMLPRDFLLEQVGFKARQFRPAWTFDMNISTRGIVEQADVRESFVEISQRMSFRDASAVLDRGSRTGRVLSALDSAVSAYLQHHPTHIDPRTTTRAGQLVEGYLQMTEEVVKGLFQAQRIPSLGYRISGAGRDYGRLGNQYQLEAALGHAEPLSLSAIQKIESLMRHARSSDVVLARQAGARLMNDVYWMGFNIAFRPVGELVVEGSTACVTLENSIAGFRTAVVDPRSVRKLGRQITIFSEENVEIPHRAAVQCRVIGIDVVRGLPLVVIEHGLSDHDT